MSVTESIGIKEDVTWTSTLIKMLCGKRTQSEFGELIGVPKNTVWRWEAGYADPQPEYAKHLSELADRERFLADGQLVGSMELVGDIEEGPKEIARRFKKSLARKARLCPKSTRIVTVFNSPFRDFD
jgi:transcriptional regulator with XRE-family HTH domain